MEVFNLTEILDGLHRVLKSTLGAKNIVNLRIDKTLPTMFDGDGIMLAATIGQVSEIISKHLINGIVQINVNSKEKNDRAFLLEINIEGSSAKKLSVNDIQEEIKTLLPHLEYKLSVGDQKITVSYVCSAKTISDGDEELVAFKDKRILLAEDNEVNVIVFSSFLDDWGTGSNIARNGKEAVELAKANTYDSILMDIHMPIMNGIEAIREIRKNDSQTPIIVLSGVDFQKDINQAFEYGANEFLKKPVSSWELYATLAKFLK